MKKYYPRIIKEILKIENTHKLYKTEIKNSHFLKHILFLLLFIGASITQIIYAQETVTNETIIQMVDLGFDNDTIIDKINTSDTDLDASITALTKLKNAGVTSEVISLILQKEKHNSKSKTGIYYLIEDQKKLIQPSVFSGSNSNAAAQVLVSGFINSKVKAQLPKTRSNNVVKSKNPEFMFIFNPATTEVDNLQSNQGNNNISPLDWWFRVASNPNEFALVKLTVKEGKNLREIITGKRNSVSSSSGIDPRNALPFSIEEVEGNKFKVIPENLEPGEYCFIYQGQVPQGRSNQSVFDFSVQ